MTKYFYRVSFLVERLRSTVLSTQSFQQACELFAKQSTFLVPTVHIINDQNGHEIATLTTFKAISNWCKGRTIPNPLKGKYQYVVVTDSTEEGVFLDMDEAWKCLSAIPYHEPATCKVIDMGTGEKCFEFNDEDSRADWCTQIDYAQSMREFPLAEWMSGYSDGNYFQVGAQLRTKDGRRFGNAVVTEALDGLYNLEKCCKAVTDVGNEVTLCESELKTHFYEPEYLMKEEEIKKRMSGASYDHKIASAGGSPLLDIQLRDIQLDHRPPFELGERLISKDLWKISNAVVAEIAADYVVVFAEWISIDAKFDKVKTWGPGEISLSNENLRKAFYMPEEDICVETTPVEDPHIAHVDPAHYKDYVDGMQWLDVMAKIPVFRSPEVFRGGLELILRGYLDRKGQKDDELRELKKARFYLQYMIDHLEFGEASAEEVHKKLPR